MAIQNVTSLGSSILLQAVGFYDVAIKIEALKSDDLWDAPDVTASEVVRGADGTFAYGAILPDNMYSFTIIPSSPTAQKMTDLINAQNNQNNRFEINLVVTVSGTKQTYFMNSGVLMTYPPIAKAAATLQPMKFGFQFKEIAGAVS